MWSSTSTASCCTMRMLARSCSPMRLSSAPTPGSCTSQHEEILLGHQRGDVRRGLAHAEADLQHRGRLAAEGRGEVQRLRAVGQQEARPELLEGAAWPVVVRPRAAHEAADGARMRHALGRARTEGVLRDSVTRPIVGAAPLRRPRAASACATCARCSRQAEHLRRGIEGQQRLGRVQRAAPRSAWTAFRRWRPAPAACAGSAGVGRPSARCSRIWRAVLSARSSPRTTCGDALLAHRRPPRPAGRPTGRRRA